MKRQRVRIALLLLSALPGTPYASTKDLSECPTAQERVFECTIESHKRYRDPFNDVEVDVVFSKDTDTWRVPAFWRGDQQWTVRFAPPVAGDYSYRLESTDRKNPDLNGHAGQVRIDAYRGSNDLLRRGPLRVSANKRYFEHSDGTPFYWLGDTWWTGLSDRLRWDGFKKLTMDRKDKGFTVVQIVAGLVPPEELAPVDPGFHNEGGFVWDADFKRINPRFFDAADRRVLHLIDAGIVPAIVGGWNQILKQMSVAQMEKHWRYVIARYGAYPVFWIVGGEVCDPPEDAVARSHGSKYYQSVIQRGWTEVAKYVRATDPYHHPLTVHEAWPPFDAPIQDESLMDFDLIQSSHFGWASIAAEVAQLNMHYSRSTVTKPVVQGEIGYEKLGESFFEDFQRTAFWLSMLNGAAGHTYGANGTWEAYTNDKLLHRSQWSFLNWEEGMQLPGSYQVGLGAKLLRQYPWWRFEPHPEWITPRGTTLLEPHDKVSGFDVGSWELWDTILWSKDEFAESLEAKYAEGEWTAKRGTFRRPYAAGVPGEVRVVYMPNFGLIQRPPPTVLGLEIGARYTAYLWEPSHGIRVDLGTVERPPPAPTFFVDPLVSKRSSQWRDVQLDSPAASEGLKWTGKLASLKGINEKDFVAAVSAEAGTPAGLVMRFKDVDNFVAAVYSPAENALFLVDQADRARNRSIARVTVPPLNATIRLSAEVRDGKAAASVTDGQRTYTTPVVDIKNTTGGSAGLLYAGQDAQRYQNFELRRSPPLTQDPPLSRKLHDARGEHRGDMVGGALPIFGLPGWDSFGKDKHILLDAYRPERLPTSGDWVLVLEANASKR